MKNGVAQTVYLLYLWVMGKTVVHGLTMWMVATLMLYGCAKPAGHAEPAFYFWKTKFQLEDRAERTLEYIGAKRIFVRIMDVDTQGPNGEAIPVSAVTFSNPVADTLDFVPVVYIVNKVFDGITDAQRNRLATQVHVFVDAKAEQAGKRGYREIQLDCDWTATTREAYFGFLETLRRQLPDSVRLSATLRLHQVRNRRSSGIPPVDRVLLMCYNMGNLRLAGEHNSILDLTEMDTYLRGFLADYPLPMDMALPLFSWSVVFREGKYAGISKRLDPARLLDTNLFAHKPGSLLYRVRTPLPEAGLRMDDVVRREETRWADLSAAADLLAAHRRKEDFTLVFYHLDSQVLSGFSDEQLQEIIHRF